MIEARTADSATAVSRTTVQPWRGNAVGPSARNIILLIGDGMGIAHRTAARIVSRGTHNGRAAGRLAMDELPLTGMVMTGSLNSVITDSSPGMAAYVTGQKGNNNQQGVSLTTRRRGSTTRGSSTLASCCDERADRVSTSASSPPRTSPIRHRRQTLFTHPTAMQVRKSPPATSTSARQMVSPSSSAAAPGIRPKAAGGDRIDERRLDDEFRAAGYTTLSSGSDVRLHWRVRPRPRACSGSSILRICRWRSTRLARRCTAMS